VRREKSDDHSCSEDEVGEIAPAGSAEQMAEWAQGEHADGNRDERATEEAHGFAGEVEDMTEREIVKLGICREQAGNVCAGWGGGRGEGEVGTDAGDEQTERNQREGRPAESTSLIGFCVSSQAVVRMSQEASDDKCERGKRGEAVVFLAAGEGEEAKDHHNPYDERD